MLVHCVFSPFITFDNVRSSLTKRQVVFPVVMVLWFILKIFRYYEHYPPIVKNAFCVFRHLLMLNKKERKNKVVTLGSLSKLSGHSQGTVHVSKQN